MFHNCKKGMVEAYRGFDFEISERSSNLMVEPPTFRIGGSCQFVRDVPKKLKLELKTRPCKNGGTYYQNQTFADLGQSCWSLSPWGCSEWEAPGCWELSKLPGCSAGPDQATWCTKKEFATLRKMKKYFYSLEKVVQLASFPAVPDHVPSPLQCRAPK